MGNWPKGEIGSNKACALLKEKIDKKGRKTKDDVENYNGTSP